jgi:hypothetical protein
MMHAKRHENERERERERERSIRCLASKNNPKKRQTKKKTNINNF